MDTRKRIIDLLTDISAQAGEPRIGTREVEILAFNRPTPAKVVFLILKQLRAEGLIVRSGGFCWLKKFPSVIKND